MDHAHFCTDIVALSSLAAVASVLVCSTVSCVVLLTSNMRVCIGFGSFGSCLVAFAQIIACVVWIFRARHGTALVRSNYNVMQLESDNTF